MKIILDENVDHRIKKYLNSKDFEVTTTQEEGLSSVNDKKILDYALKEDKAILTHDEDFLSIIDKKEDFSNHNIFTTEDKIQRDEEKVRGC